jgi:serine/threonine protein kinase
LGASTLLPGATIQGRYAILRKIGQGGMGAVYLVSDLRLGSKSMALKELSDAGLINPEEKATAVASFQSEARLLAQLDHPNIPRVTDFFTEAGRHYLVMELVSGEDLEACLARRGRPYSEAEVYDWTLQLCDVLAYLHRQNPPIIFRDLKPGNIMVTAQGQLKLIDFGIARLFRPGKIKDTLAMGTVGYAPPEQYGTGQTNARSDIYSLGLTLHHLLTGYDPATTPFVHPPVRQLNPLISSRMERVIAKATWADPNLRYGSVAEMLEDLVGGAVALPPTVGPVIPGPPSSPPIAAGWTMKLPISLDSIKARLFAESREGIVNNIVRAIGQTNPEVSGMTIMLRGIGGFGGTTIATRVRDRILRNKRALTLVATLDLSNAGPPIDLHETLEDLTQSFRRSGMSNRRLQSILRPVSHSGNLPAQSAPGEEVFRQRYLASLRTLLERRFNEGELRTFCFELQIEYDRLPGNSMADKPRELVTYCERHGRMHDLTQTGTRLRPDIMWPEPIPVKLELITSPAQGTPRQLVAYSLEALKELVDQLLLHGIRVVLVFDKLRHIEALRPLLGVTSRGGVYTIVVANMDDYTPWCRQSPDLVKQFSKKDFYVPCVWDLAPRLCTDLILADSDRESPEFRILQRYLEYKGRGIPGELVRALDPFHDPAPSSSMLNRIAGRSVSDKLRITPEQWPEIIRCAELQETLGRCWSDVFGVQGIPPLQSLSQGAADRSRIAVYDLSDWLLEQAEQGMKVGQSAVLNWASTKLRLPFDGGVSRKVIARFINFLVQEKKITVTNQGLDLSGMLTAARPG